MRIVVAPDKLKGCLSAGAAAGALARGVRRARPDAEVVELPIADGGEGTLAALLAARGGEAREAQVTGPLGEPVVARWGLFPDGTALVESAEAIGLWRVPPERRDPLRATSRGVGELIRAALGSGARRITVALGGSATVDGGAGMFQGLGARLLDAGGREPGPGGGALESLARIDAGPLDVVELVAACDVDAPLLGPHGAARAYGPQKGADPPAVEGLERGLARWAELLARDLGRAVADLPGAGAAGGLGAGLAALGARLVPGADFVLDALELERRLAGTALVVTAEGALDATTLRGKATWAVCRRARRAGVPCVAVGGRIDPGARAALTGPDGFLGLFELGGASLADSIERAPELLERAGEAVGKMAL